MSKENNAEDNGGDLHQLILLQQQQQQENFSLLASSLGGTLNTFGNSFKQYLEVVIRNTSRSPVSEDPDLGNRQNMLSEHPKGNRLAKIMYILRVTEGMMLKTPIIPGLMSLETQNMAETHN